MRALSLNNAKVWDGSRYIEANIYIENGIIVAQKPRDAITLNLDGNHLLPALVNHHDHLELNHFPRTKYRTVYDNAHQWGEDVNIRLNDEPFKTLRAYPLRDKLFIGGLKNLLCGAITVVQHGTPFKDLFRHDYPVNVKRHYGWAHSLHFDTPEQIVKSYHATPSNQPWYIHLAEGTNAIATGEYQQLKALGCIGKNTIIVHGVGLSPDDLIDFAHTTENHATIIVCPTTNQYLLGAMLDIEQARQLGIRVHIGSDSRLTADNDLLGEYTVLNQHLPRQKITVGDKANYIIVANDKSIKRHDLALVIRGGQAVIGNPEFMAHTQGVTCQIDGQEKIITLTLAKQVHRCTLKEPNFIVDRIPSKRFLIF